METRKLSLQEMELTQAGWDWGNTACNAAGLAGAFAFGLACGHIVGLIAGGDYALACQALDEWS